jgi:hypothetical protein
MNAPPKPKIAAMIIRGTYWMPSCASARSRPSTLMTIDSRNITARLVAIKRNTLFMVFGFSFAIRWG